MNDELKAALEVLLAEIKGCKNYIVDENDSWSDDSSQEHAYHQGLDFAIEAFEDYVENGVKTFLATLEAVERDMRLPVEPETGQLPLFGEGEKTQ